MYQYIYEIMYIFIYMKVCMYAYNNVFARIMGNVRMYVMFMYNTQILYALWNVRVYFMFRYFRLLLCFRQDGWTALYSASYAGHLQTVEILLDRGADIEARSEKVNENINCLQVNYTLSTHVHIIKICWCISSDNCSSF